MKIIESTFPPSNIQKLMKEDLRRNKIEISKKAEIMLWLEFVLYASKLASNARNKLTSENKDLTKPKMISITEETFQELHG